jgi:hypothetical protein
MFSEARWQRTPWLYRRRRWWIVRYPAMALAPLSTVFPVSQSRSWFPQAKDNHRLGTRPQHRVEVSAHRWGLVTVILEIGLTNIHRATPFWTHCQVLSADKLLSKRRIDGCRKMDYVCNNTWLRKITICIRKVRGIPW